MSTDTSNPSRFDRRSVLRGMGAGALAMTGLSASVGSVGATAEEPAGYLVLIYDDSPREDYTKAFPVHDEYDVPGCAAVCPGLMGTTSDWLHPEHLTEMSEAGWEVMSHTWKHRALAEIPVRSDIQEDDEAIHVDSNLHGRFEGDPLVIFDGSTEVTATVAGRDENEDEDYLLLEEPIGGSFAAGDGFETWVRYTDEFTQEVLAGSKAELEDWGHEVTAYVHTYNRADGYVSEVVPEFYDAVPNASRGVLNSTYEPDPLALRRDNFEDPSMSDEELEHYLDTIANEPDFGILYGHANRDGFTADRIETTIQMAQERDIEIVTLREALIAFDVFEGEEPEEDEAAEDDEPEDEPVEGADDDADAEEEDDDDEAFGSEADDAIPGFGLGAAAAGIGGAGYLLKRRIDRRDEDT